MKFHYVVETVYHELRYLVDIIVEQPHRTTFQRSRLLTDERTLLFALLAAVDENLRTLRRLGLNKKVQRPARAFSTSLHQFFSAYRKREPEDPIEWASLGEPATVLLQAIATKVPHRRRRLFPRLGPRPTRLKGRALRLVPLAESTEAVADQQSA